MSRCKFSPLRLLTQGATGHSVLFLVYLAFRLFQFYGDSRSFRALQHKKKRLNAPKRYLRITVLIAKNFKKKTGCSKDHKNVNRRAVPQSTVISNDRQPFPILLNSHCTLLLSLVILFYLHPYDYLIVKASPVGT
jgi:hypothetical protein